MNDQNHSGAVTVGDTGLATDGTKRTGSPLDEHAFCPRCGYCLECEDCAIWGCGAEDEPS